MTVVKRDMFQDSICVFRGGVVTDVKGGLFQANVSVGSCRNFLTMSEYGAGINNALVGVWKGPYLPASLGHLMHPHLAA